MSTAPALPTSTAPTTPKSTLAGTSTSSITLPAESTVSESLPSEANPHQYQQRQQGLGDAVTVLGMTFSRWKNANLKTPNSTRDHLKPLLLYLAGVDGLGTSIEPQLPALSEKFRVYRLVIGAQDRSTFAKLSAAVAGFADIAGEMAGEGEEDKVVVLGESFGGMLGLRLGQLR